MLSSDVAPSGGRIFGSHCNLCHYNLSCNLVLVCMQIGSDHVKQIRKSLLSRKGNVDFNKYGVFHQAYNVRSSQDCKICIPSKSQALNLKSTKNSLKIVKNERILDIKFTLNKACKALFKYIIENLLISIHVNTFFAVSTSSTLLDTYFSKF